MWHFVGNINEVRLNVSLTVRPHNGKWVVVLGFKRRGLDGVWVEALPLLAVSQPFDYEGVAWTATKTQLLAMGFEQINGGS